MGDMSYYMTIGATVVVGLFTTVVYYMARYSFKSHKDDTEILPSLKKDEALKGGEKTEALPEPEVSDEKKSKPALESKPVEKQKTLQDALANTKQNFFGRIKQSLVGKTTLDDQDIELLEEVLYTSDIGPATVQQLMSAVGEKLDSSEKRHLSVVQEALRSEINNIFQKVHTVDYENLSDTFQVQEKPKEMQVWLIVGVNGAGKTTSIGKLANLVAQNGLKVLVAAGDTFRAAAGEQLETWTQRAQVEIFSPPGVKDPSAVAFDACQKGKSGGFDIVIIDTAGRLHTQDNLMEELKKMKRVIAKVDGSAPHQTLIVLDANSGQNALMQAKNFNNILDLSGAILTKLDGTAKGGVAIGLAGELSLPIRAIGVGEGLNDLRPFKPKEFVDSII